MIQIASTPLLKLTIRAYTSHITKLEIQIAVAKTKGQQNHQSNPIDLTRTSALEKEHNESMNMLDALATELFKNEDHS